MELWQLRTFRIVAETLNFTRAAERLNLTQSAVSHQDEAQAMRERVSGREHSPVGRVRAAAATQAFVHLFASLFESFMRASPGVELSFRTTVSTDQTVTDILN